jgi:type II secretory pathway component PulM
MGGLGRFDLRRFMTHKHLVWVGVVLILVFVFTIFVYPLIFGTNQPVGVEPQLQIQK